VPQPSIELDHRGIAEILNSPEVANAVHETAVAIATDVGARLPADADAADVAVDDYRTDRAASSVTIRDTRGRIWQVRDGILTRAAASQGLEVTHR